MAFTPSNRLGQQQKSWFKSKSPDTDISLNLVHPIRRQLRWGGLLPSLRHVHHGGRRGDRHTPRQLRLSLPPPPYDGRQWDDEVQAGPRQEEGQGQGQGRGKQEEQVSKQLRLVSGV